MSRHCVEWKGSYQGKGYGQAWCKRRKRPVGAHIYAWENANNRQVPTGMVIMHTCDNRRCVNPDHLVLGTTRENNADMRRKGRAHPPPTRNQAGEHNPNAKINQAIAKEIREAEGTHSKIAARFGVSRSLVTLIKQGKLWRSE